VKKIIFGIITHKRIIFIALITALATIMGLGNLPMWFEHDGVAAQYKKLEYDVVEQELLQPVFKEIILEKQNIAPKGTPLPKLSRKKTINVLELVEQLDAMGQQTGLEDIKVTPFPDSFRRGGDTFAIGCTVLGTYIQLQPFLLKIGTLSTLYGVDEMDVVSLEKGVSCTLKLRFTVGE
jgi:Tfp pilus assembly protein PilO